MSSEEPRCHGIPKVPTSEWQHPGLWDASWPLNRTYIRLVSLGDHVMEDYTPVYPSAPTLLVQGHCSGGIIKLTTQDSSDRSIFSHGPITPDTGGTC